MSSEAKVLHTSVKEAGSNTKGWILGHFQEDPLLKTGDIEVLVGESGAGDHRDTFSCNLQARFITLIISGCQEVETSEGTFILRAGDFLRGEPGVAHRFRTLEDCKTITIKWPSIAGDVKSFTTLDEWREALSQ